MIPTIRLGSLSSTANSLETHPLASPGLPCSWANRRKASCWPALSFARMIVPYIPTSSALTSMPPLLECYLLRRAGRSPGLKLVGLKRTDELLVIPSSDSRIRRPRFIPCSARPCPTPLGASLLASGEVVPHERLRPWCHTSL